MATQQQQFGFDLTHAEVQTARGTPQETFARVRRNCGLSSRVSLREIFYRTCAKYHGIPTADSRAYTDYKTYLSKRHREGYVLPEYVYRYGDDDETVDKRI